MPELPEVETTRRGIITTLMLQKAVGVTVRHYGLRWPVPKFLSEKVADQRLLNIKRRGKYLLFQFEKGFLLIHLGMSGSLRVLPLSTPYLKHDHVEIIFSNQKSLRFNDPRRFGAVLWLDDAPDQHFLLQHLGVEPLEKNFNANYLSEKAKRRKTSVKQLIMDAKIVVGVGNIYANEALFLAGIHPQTLAGKVSPQSYKKLVVAIKKVLRDAIRQGGTTLRDYVSSDGKPGYFVQRLNVYGRNGALCKQCKSTLKTIRLGQRSTYFCPSCQKK